MIATNGYVVQTTAYSGESPSQVHTLYVPELHTLAIVTDLQETTAHGICGPREHSLRARHSRDCSLQLTHHGLLCDRGHVKLSALDGSPWRFLSKQTPDPVPLGSPITRVLFTDRRYPAYSVDVMRLGSQFFFAGPEKTIHCIITTTKDGKEISIYISMGDILQLMSYASVLRTSIENQALRPKKGNKGSGSTAIDGEEKTQIDLITLTQKKQLEDVNVAIKNGMKAIGVEVEQLLGMPNLEVTLKQDHGGYLFVSLASSALTFTGRSPLGSFTNRPVVTQKPTQLILAPGGAYDFSSKNREVEITVSEDGAVFTFTATDPREPSAPNQFSVSIGDIRATFAEASRLKSETLTAEAQLKASDGTTSPTDKKTQLNQIIGANRARIRLLLGDGHRKIAAVCKDISARTGIHFSSNVSEHELTLSVTASFPADEWRVANKNNPDTSPPLKVSPPEVKPAVLDLATPGAYVFSTGDQKLHAMVMDPKVPFVHCGDGVSHHFDISTFYGTNAALYEQIQAQRKVAQETDEDPITFNARFLRETLELPSQRAESRPEESGKKQNGEEKPDSNASASEDKIVFLMDSNGHLIWVEEEGSPQSLPFILFQQRTNSVFAWSSRDETCEVLHQGADSLEKEDAQKIFNQSLQKAKSTKPSSKETSSLPDAKAGDDLRAQAQRAIESLSGGDGKSDWSRLLEETSIALHRLHLNLTYPETSIQDPQEISISCGDSLNKIRSDVTIIHESDMLIKYTHRVSEWLTENSPNRLWSPEITAIFALLKRNTNAADHDRMKGQALIALENLEKKFTKDVRGEIKLNQFPKWLGEIENTPIPPELTALRMVERQLLAVQDLMTHLTARTQAVQKNNTTPLTTAA